MAEFSRLIKTDTIQSKSICEEISATPQECHLLATRFDLEAILSLSAVIVMKRISPGTVIQVNGSLEAALAQNCVVSLDLVDSKLEAPFETFFHDGEVPAELFADLQPDPALDGTIDIGEMVAQNLSLALNPYPRSEAVALKLVDKPEAAAEAKPSPFAILAETRKAANES